MNWLGRHEVRAWVEFTRLYSPDPSTSSNSILGSVHPIRLGQLVDNAAAHVRTQATHDAGNAAARWAVIATPAESAYIVRSNKCGLPASISFPSNTRLPRPRADRPSHAVSDMRCCADGAPLHPVSHPFFLRHARPLFFGHLRAGGLRAFSSATKQSVKALAARGLVLWLFALTWTVRWRRGIAK
jgi:hypothetical protein